MIVLACAKDLFHLRAQRFCAYVHANFALGLLVSNPKIWTLISRPKGMYGFIRQEIPDPLTLQFFGIRTEVCLLAADAKQRKTKHRLLK